MSHRIYGEPSNKYVSVIPLVIHSILVKKDLYADSIFFSSLKGIR